MSDSHEPSYYEIALTNRQVLFAFVILLVCLLGSFIAGVWVGRGGETAAAAGPPAAERVAAAGAGPGSGEGDGELERMSFFGDDRGAAGGSARPPASGGPTAGAAGGPTTLREDLGAGAAESEPPPPEPEPEPEPARTPPPATAAAADRTAPPGPVPAPPAPARSAPAAAAEPPAAAGLVVQVFSSRDPDQARKIVDRLNRGGSPAYLSPVEVSGQTMYRVRVGPYTDRAEAQRVADQIRRDFKLDTWITQ